jgi:ABC-type transporter MlaC component
MKKILIALASLAVLGATQTAFAQAKSTDAVFDEAKQVIGELQADKKAVMLQTLQLNDKQLAKFTPIYDEYLAEQKKLGMDVYNLSNRFFVANYGGITNDESKDLMKQYFGLRKDRTELLKKYADKLEKELPATKVLQFVQVENKITAILDLALAASTPIASKK